MLNRLTKDVDSGVSRDACLEQCDDIKKSIDYRSKLLNIADQDEGGWEAVRECERSSLADDEKVYKRLKSARAAAKRKIKERLVSSKRRVAWSNRGPNNSIGEGRRAEITRRVGEATSFSHPQPFHREGPGQRRRPGPNDVCFRCGGVGHWKGKCREQK